MRWPNDYKLVDKVLVWIAVAVIGGAWVTAGLLVLYYCLFD